jgi:acetyl-CoA carboxylase biotin carboxyl carrier protein
MRAKEIRELVKILEESNVGELEITYWWGRKIRISKTPSTVSMAAAPAPAVGHLDIMTQAKPVVAPAAPPAVDPAKAPAAETKAYIEIKAPMVGTFYRAPSPEAAPYIREGDAIAPGKVLCIIEAMKLMNEIEAEVSGKIHKIMVENGRPVEYNQILFLVDPQ